MGCADRTPEFRQLVAGLAAQGVGQQDAAPVANPSPQSSGLNGLAHDIGKGINDASLQVQELRRMAKKKGIFNDRTNEIQELTYGVKKSIEVLNQKVEALERQVRGTGQNRNYQVHTKNLVDTLKTRLAQTTKDFKDALEERTKALEHQEQRRGIYTSGANTFGRPQPTPSGNAGDLEGGGSMSMTMSQQNVSSRAEAVQNVQRTIAELATMFQKMAVLVTAQEEMIQRIDDDVDNTLKNVEIGQEHLLKYFKYISSNRALILKVFLIFIFFVIFFVVFLA